MMDISKRDLWFCGGMLAIASVAAAWMGAALAAPAPADMIAAPADPIGPIGPITPAVPPAEGATTVVVSVNDSGDVGNANSQKAYLSGDGRYVVFRSSASNLVSGDNGTEIFLHDRNTATTTRVSLSSDGESANNSCDDPSVSDDGRYVAFSSLASNLVPGHMLGGSDIFVRDRSAGTTELVSSAMGGGDANAQSFGPSISGDGRYVAFYSFASDLVAGDTNSDMDVFVRFLPTGGNRLVSVSSVGEAANDRSFSPTLSTNGQFVAFGSVASNLVAGDSNDEDDIFVHDIFTRETTRVSVSSAGVQGNGDSRDAQISGDGRYVVFTSDSTNLVAGDTNGVADIFVHDRQTGTTERVNLASDGAQANGGSSGASISSDGRYVSFQSVADNLVAGDSNGEVDIFIRDRQTGQTTRVNVTTDGSQSDADATRARLSADGRYVAFETDSATLVAGDTNNFDDIFVRGLLLPGLGNATALSGITGFNKISQAGFFGGATADGGMSFPNSFTTADDIDILIDIDVDPDDAGQGGELLILALYSGTPGQTIVVYRDSTGAFQIWDGQLSSLEAADGPRLLQPFENVLVVRGLTGLAGTFLVFAGYRDVDGDIHFHTTPIAFAVR